MAYHDVYDDDSGYSFEVDLDYDWQHADSAHASGSFLIWEDDEDDLTDADKAEVGEEIAGLLRAQNSLTYRLSNIYGNKAVCLQVRKINGEEIEETNVLFAIARRLKENPEERFFEMEGVMG
jgi:hypothetical protein